MILFLLLLTTGSQTLQQPEESITDLDEADDESAVVGLGQGFYLPDTALIKDNGAGRSLFTAISSECVIEVPRYIAQRKHTYYKNTDSFYTSIATASSLGGALKVSGFTLSATLNVASSSIDSETLDVKGAKLEVSATTRYSEVKDDCLRSKTGLELREDLTKEFESLPARISNPGQKSSWYQYAALIKNYGSHAIKRISYGSKLTNYIFSKSSQDISKRELEVKACLALKDANVSVCSDFNSTQYSNVQRYETSQEVIVRGGATRTRAKLTNTRSAELLEQFIMEANVTKQPIGQQYVSIWDILKSRYTNTEHYAKAVNLESYYLGFLDTGCHYLEEDGQGLRRFVLKRYHEHSPEYECQLRSEGCRSNDDCHFVWGASWCACHGETCFRTTKASAIHSLQDSREIQWERQDGRSDGANRFCYFSYHWSGLAFSSCKCDMEMLGEDWVRVWPQ